MLSIIFTKILCWPTCQDWVIFLIGVAVTIAWALFIYFFFRPSIAIECPRVSIIDGISIVIPITNAKKYRKVTRIKVEVAVIDANKNTYHLTIVDDDFAFLKPMESRDFKAYMLNDYLTANLNLNFNLVLSMLNMPNSFLRVRVHGTDGFSGLGGSFEAQFVSYQEDYITYGFALKSE